MRSWRKWGVFLAGLACTAIAQAIDSKPIEDREAFEKQYIECMKNVLKDNCSFSFFGEHVSPEVDGIDENKTNKFNVTLQELIRKSNGIYKIHVVEKKITATIYDNRTYLMELENGNLVGLRVIFRRMLGKWYIESVKVSPDRDVIGRLLGLFQSNGDNL